MQDSLRRRLQFQKIIEESKYSEKKTTDSTAASAKEPGVFLLPQNRHLTSPSRLVSPTPPPPSHENLPLEESKKAENSRRDRIQEQLKRLYGMNATYRHLQTKVKLGAKQVVKKAAERFILRSPWFWAAVGILLTGLFLVVLIATIWNNSGLWDKIKTGSCITTGAGCEDVWKNTFSDENIRKAFQK